MDKCDGFQCLKCTVFVVDEIQANKISDPDEIKPLYENFSLRNIRFCFQIPQIVVIFLKDIVI